MANLCSSIDLESTSTRLCIRREQLQHKRDRVGVVAVKLNGEGWIGITTIGQRCRGHCHRTPELAKLCALHRDGGERALNVILLPLAEPSTANH